MAYTPLQLAEAFIKAGELTDALDALNQQLEDDPKDDESRRLRAEVLLRLGKESQLRQAIDDLQAIDEQTAVDFYLLSVVAERHDENVKRALDFAQQAYEASDEEPQKSRALERVLDLMRKAGELRAALTLALEKDWVQWAADAAADLHDDEQALTYYGEALARIEGLYSRTSPEMAANIKARVLLKRGGVYQRMGKLAEADLDFDAAVKVIPDDPMIPFNRGLIAMKEGKTKDATEYVQSALENVPVALREMMHDEVKSDDAYVPLLGLFDESQ